MRTLLFVGIAVAVLAGVLFAFLKYNEGERIRLEGSLQKVREEAPEPHSTVVIADFRLTNPSRYPFVVRSTDIEIETAEGMRVEGSFVSETDAIHVFEQFPLLGPKYNDTLVPRTRIPPGETIDRMATALFDVPLGVVRNRKNLKVKIVEIDGKVTEVLEKKTS